jgi:rhamnogalacturonyl hydrolase YesR
MAWGYLTMFKITKNPHYKDKAAACLEWLVANKSEGYTHHCWGNHFDFSSRGGKQAKYVPTIVWSSLIGQAFLDGYELLGEKKYLDVAADISDWILSLPRKQTQNGLCLAYAPEEESTVHNSNMLGAAMLARMATFIPNVEARRVAALAMAYSCNHQLPSGAWYYGEEINTRWIDNFHTGYNLDSLKCYMDSTGDRTYQDNLFRGFRYFKDVFFEPSGKPRYYHNRTYPVDIQCAAQAITTLANFSEYDSSSLSLAIKVAGWTLGNMQDKSGYFYYRMLPWFKVKIPMLHWGQATMYRGLALLLSKLDSSLVSITPEKKQKRS